tara:strand:- start:501 stop:2675 length:2175 start_codon:yes stop_codon:yes gene_type:complete
MPGSKNRNIGIPRNVSSDNFRISKSGGKIKLFAKYNNKWYATPLEDAFNINNLNQARKHSIVTYNNGSGELNPAITAEPNGKLSIRDNKSDSKVVIKNDSGVLKVRNSRDDEDAVVKAKTLRLPSVAPTPVVGDLYYNSGGGGHILHGVGLGINAFTTTTATSQSASLAIISKGNDGTAGYGDAFVKLLSESTNVWAFGNDASDSNKFKIHNGSALVDDSLLDLDSSGNMSIDGTLTAGGFTTTGTWTFDTSAGGTTGITQINVGSAFTDNDTTLMSAGAIKEKIEAYGYSTASGDITGVTLTGDSGGALADTAGSADFTIAGGTNCATSGSGSTITVNVDDAFLKNDDDDTMAGTLTIDKDVSNTSAGTYEGLSIDFDKTGTSTSDNTLNALRIDADNTTATNGTNELNGINNTPTLTHNADAGTAIVRGLHQTVTGHSNGAARTFGINQIVTGGDLSRMYGIYQTVDNGGVDILLTSSANTGDYCTIATTNNGATTIQTIDADAELANFILDIDGDIELNADGGEITLKDDSATFGEFSTAASKSSFKLYESGGSSTDDYLQIVTAAHGATVIKTHDDAAGAANLGFNIDGHIDMNDSPVGFNQFEPTYGGTNTDVDYRTNSNKAFATFGAGSITNIRLYFPAISGNFILLLKQDGTGSRTVTNWNAYDSAGNAAGGSSTVKFAGGSNPTLTTDANHVDIFSFYWDADNEIAYGAATLDFQF